MFYKVVILLLIFSGGIDVNAQSADTSKQNKSSCSFTSIIQVGMVAGEANDSYQLQTVNGIKYKTWMAGVGIGIDGYRYRSIPLFLQLRKEFNLSTNALFLYSDIGLNYPWVKDSQKEPYSVSKYAHGVYYDGGLGYKLLLKRQSILFSSGFTLKEMSEDRSSSDICPFVGPCFETKDVYHYSLKRLSFKVGLQL
jgi:hypothetical protein